MNNIALLTDSYKLGHYNMYPDKTEYVYSYFEARKGAKYDETTFFGLQIILMKYLEGIVITPEQVEEARTLVDQHLGPESFNYDGWMYIATELNGKLPLEIKAVPEGTPIPINNVLMTVINTDTKCFWLTNFMETILTHVWYTCTVATKSREVKGLLTKFLLSTGATLDGLDFQLHDFGFRSCSSVESAGAGGLAHLVNFQGTDTVVALQYAKDYYGAESAVGYSVPATEHSIMTTNPDNEEEIYHQLFKNYPTGILSVVCDSYDIFNCVENIIGGTFRHKIMERDGVFVVRPDSGEPTSTVIKILEILETKFPVTENELGFKVLDPHIRVLWGDGIDTDGIERILVAMRKNFWSAENIVFGMGGGLLQNLNRDVQRFAFKSSAQCVNGSWHDVYKNPLDQSKASKRGRLKLIKVNGSHGSTYKTTFTGDAPDDVMKVVFRNGELINPITFEQVRENGQR